MARSYFGWLLAAAAVLSCVGSAVSEEEYEAGDLAPATSGRRMPLLEDLNSLGRNLFSNGQNKTVKPMTAGQSVRPRTEETNSHSTPPSRAGSVLSVPKTSVGQGAQPYQNPGSMAPTSETPRSSYRTSVASSGNSPLVVRNPAASGDRPVERALPAGASSGIARGTDFDQPIGPTPRTAISSPGPNAVSDPPRSSSDRFEKDLERSPSAAGVQNRPLHQRMSSFRRSPGEWSDETTSSGRDDAPAATAKGSGAAEVAVGGADRTIHSEGPTPAKPIGSRPAVVEHSPAVVPVPKRPVAKPTGPTDSDPSFDIGNESLATSPRTRLIQSAASPTLARPEPEQRFGVGQRSPAPTSAAEPRQPLLVRKSPTIAVETLGPRKITVGKEAVYELIVVNSGEVPAEELVVHVELPPWTEPAGVDTSSGIAQFGQADQTARSLAWRVGTLAAGARERMALRLIPRESRPFDLAVRWDYRPAAVQAQIEVQEAKLVMQLEGPREVFFGRKELFVLRLANVGTGDAENVVITLMPIGPSENPPASHRLGLLKAGEERSVEIELTARQTGELSIHVKTQADHGVRAELAEKVLVRRAALNVEVVGPQVQFVNSAGVYRLRVANTGNAAARQVRLQAALPPGAKYLGGIEGSHLDAGDTRVAWAIDTLPAGAERFFELRCLLATPGVNKLEIAAVADDELTAVAEAATRVDAIADLRLEVKDPQGPVPVGEEAVYELRVRNRGSKAAENVEVLAFFSNGIEPIAGEGAAARIQPGQVIFQPIASIAPGAEVVLRVRAKAETAGAHIFRAEVHCRELAARLVSEETTHYYQTGGSAPMMAAPARNEPTARTAEQQYVPPGTPTGTGGLRR